MFGCREMPYFCHQYIKFVYTLQFLSTLFKMAKNLWPNILLPCGAANETVRQKSCSQTFFQQAGKHFFLSVGRETYYHRRGQSSKTSKRAGRDFDVKSAGKFWKSAGKIYSFLAGSATLAIKSTYITQQNGLGCHDKQREIEIHKLKYGLTNISDHTWSR